MKLRTVKKRNKKIINKALCQLSGVYNVHLRCSHLACFAFPLQPAMECIFQLKQLPGWVFGIFLNGEGGYDIFGEISSLIDKFRPYHIPTCEKSVDKFKVSKS